VTPLQGFTDLWFDTQGVALGWYVAAPLVRLNIGYDFV
jgi:hypothetical protein